MRRRPLNLPLRRKTKLHWLKYRHISPCPQQLVFPVGRCISLTELTVGCCICGIELKIPRGAMKAYWTNEQSASDQDELFLNVEFKTVRLISNRETEFGCLVIFYVSKKLGLKSWKFVESMGRGHEWVPTLDGGRVPTLDGGRVPTLDRGRGTYLGWRRGTYLGWRGRVTYLGWKGIGYLSWMGEGYLPCTGGYQL